MSSQIQPGDRVTVDGVLCEAVAWHSVDIERTKAFATSLGKPATVCGLCPAASAPDDPATDLCMRTPCDVCIFVPIDLVGPLKLANVIRGEP